MRIFRLLYVRNLYQLLQSNNTDILGNEYQINDLKSHPILCRKYVQFLTMTPFKFTQV